jgi:hypothetical protein
MWARERRTVGDPALGSPAERAKAPAKPAKSTKLATAPACGLENIVLKFGRGAGGGGVGCVLANIVHGLVGGRPNLHAYG